MRFHRVVGSPVTVWLVLAPCLASQSPSHPGEVLWGSNNYVEYIVGNAPLVLSMPHGGYLKPAGVKNRTYGVTTQDARTQETGREILEKFRNRYGLHPHVVISHLHRSKLDPNREIVEAAQGDKIAEQAWRDFHGFIETARKAVAARYGKGLVIDVHGHAHAQNWIELGYLLTNAELNQSNSTLNGSAYVVKSSIRTLAAANATVPFAELLRGASSLGGLLQARSLSAVPAPAIPGPGSNSYFRGGYVTDRWGSRNGGAASGGPIDAVQCELPSSLRRDLTGRAAFTTALVDSLLPFFTKYYKIDLTSGPRITVTASMPTGTERGDPCEFTIERTGDTTKPLSVPLLIGGSATPGQDYQSLPTTASIAAGRATVKLKVAPVQDTSAEGQETITITLLPIAASGAPPIGFPNTATAILLDDEKDPQVAGHWPLDESSGTTANDISGANRHGTLVPLSGGPTRVIGVLTGALSFDETNDRVVIPAFDYAARTEFTLSFWFRAPRSTQGSTQYFFSHGDVNAVNSLNVYRFESTGLLRTWIRCQTDINSSLLLDIERDFMDDQWHFYCLTVEPGFDFASVYIDGVRHAHNRIGGDRLRPSGPLNLGARQDLSSSRYLRGRIDDVMLQSRHLTPAEVFELHASSRGYARPYGTGCKTSAATLPLHGLQGTPSAGATVVYEVVNAAPATSGVFYFGFSRGRIAGATLPLDLGVVGAPGCPLLQDTALSAAVGIVLGKGSLLLRIPADPTLRGLRVYSQVMVLDGAANTVGFAVSNGLATVVGG